MCRLYGFRANEPTKVECTLVRAQNAMLVQSLRDRRGISHPDGWGIAVFENGTPEVERRATAAHEDAHFSATAERIFCHAVVAHVRQATVGTPSAANTHPFTYGQWVFAHNGTVRGFPVLEPLLMEETEPNLLPYRHGTTDSEMAFLWLLSRLTETGLDLADPEPDCKCLIKTLCNSIKLLSKRCQEADPDLQERLNFLLTNGDVMIISRWHNDLWFVERQGLHDCEICGIPHVHHQSAKSYRAVIAASEPISHEHWQEVPEAHLLVIEPGVRTRLVPI